MLCEFYSSNKAVIKMILLNGWVIIHDIHHFYITLGEHFCVQAFNMSCN